MNDLFTLNTALMRKKLARIKMIQVIFKLMHINCIGYLELCQGDRHE
tara:strand:+ start:311703 stop:311843 length:141 start_codon:yes stop_codon:yes gene_type:complete